MTVRPIHLLLAAALAAATLAGCGDDDGDVTTSPGAVTLRLLTHDSFAVSDDVFDRFTAETGITVELLQGGDAGTVVNQAILTQGNPQADVLFGVDSTFVSRALAADLFVPHAAEGLDAVDPAFVLDPEHRVTPIDYGDVCLNYDRAYFEDNDLAVPGSLDDLLDPAYRDLLVVQNPATSSPGLAFLLATVEAFGEDGWTDFWAGLRANGVEVTDGWEDAYYGAFSGGGGSEGRRPLVVSYASSPPAEVVFADPPIEEAPTGVIDATCYRQVEAAGILRGTEHEAEAALLIDFLLSTPFQEDVPLSMFVFPVNPDAELPAVFVEHAATPAEVFELEPEVVDANREEWISTWTDVVLR
jgi:thiamine transport system substrate-binding protein